MSAWDDYMPDDYYERPESLEERGYKEGDPCPECEDGIIKKSSKGNLYCGKMCWLSEEERELQEMKDKLKEGDICPECGEGKMVLSKKGKLYCANKCWMPTQINVPEEGDPCPKCGEGVMLLSKKGNLYCSEMCWKEETPKIKVGGKKKRKIIKCKTCSGEGIVGSDSCPICDGAGEVGE